MSKLTRGVKESIVGAVALLTLAVVGSAVAASSFDPGFGQGGVVETPLPADERESIFGSSQGPLIRDLSVGPNGELFAAIGSGTETGFFGAVSYNRNGSLNRRFAGDGFAQTKKIFPSLFRHAEAQAQGVAAQRDGKTILVGFQTRAFRNSVPVVMRLLPDGRADQSFGVGGLTVPRPHGSSPEVLHGVAIHPSGRIVAVGSLNEEKPRGGPPAGLVVAYRKDGRVDRSFGNNGRILFFSRREKFPFTGLFDISILPSDKILIAGYRAGRLFVARLRTNGRLDHGFGGGDGKVSIDLDQENSCCPATASLFALRDGSSVVVAKKYPGSAIFRFRADGSLDPRFGRRGVVSGKIGRKIGVAHDVAVQGNGKIVVVGVSGRRRLIFSIVRFRPSGKLDRAFGKEGAERLLNGRGSFGTSAVTLPNGQVVVGGGAQYRKGDEFEYSLLLAKLRP